MERIRNINLISLLKLKSLKIQAVIVLAVVVFIVSNLILMPVSLRMDLSYGKAYSLSSSTKKIVKNLDDVVAIKFYASSDLPGRLLPLKNEVVDLLNEYKRENKNKLAISVLDPKKNQKSLEEAKESGLPELQFSQLERDKYAVTASYFGIIISYGGSKEVLPQVTDVESLEYNLTASIYKLTKKELAKIGVLGYEETPNPREDELSLLKQIFRQQFTVDAIDISKEIDASYETILVLDNNKKEYNEQEIAILKKYLDNKGKAIFFIDGVWVLDNLTTQPSKHNLFPLLSEYGIRLNSNLLLSTSSELVNFGGDLVTFMAPYPFWLKTNNYDQKISFFSNVNQLTYPWASSLTIQKSKDLTIKELVKTTKKSWEQKDGYVLDPQNIPQPAEKDLKEYLISAYSEKKGGGAIMVFPSSRFVLNRYLTRTSDNLGLVLNVANDFASGGALSGIRQRQVSFYPLPEIPDAMKDIFKYINILLLPFLLVIFGVVRLLLRR